MAQMNLFDVQYEPSAIVNGKLNGETRFDSKDQLVKPLQSAKQGLSNQINEKSLFTNHASVDVIDLESSSSIGSAQCQLHAESQTKTLIQQQSKLQQIQLPSIDGVCLQALESEPHQAIAAPMEKARASRASANQSMSSSAQPMTKNRRANDAKSIHGGKRNIVQSSTSLVTKHLGAELAKYTRLKKVPTSMLITDAIELIRLGRKSEKGRLGNRRKSETAQLKALPRLAALTDYLELCQVSHATASANQTAVNCNSAPDSAETNFAGTGYINLAWVEHTDGKSLLFASPEIVIAVQRLMQRTISVSGLDRQKNQTVFCTVVCLDLTDVHQQTSKALLDDGAYIKALEKERNEVLFQSKPLALAQLEDFLSGQLLQMLSAGFLEAYFRYHKPVDKFRLLPQRFRDAHFNLTDAQWNALRNEPLRSQFDALILAITDRRKMNIPFKKGTQNINPEGAEQNAIGGEN